MNAPRRSRKWLIALIVVFLFFFLGHEAQKRRFETADRGFSSVTGLPLPANVHAMAHGGLMNDNLMHSTHYWLLQGPKESLRELAPPPHFERSDEDASQVLREARQIVTLPSDAQMLEGYEGSRDGGRDRWLMIIAPGDRAIFVW